MSAPDNISYDQLQMFMTARQLRTDLRPGDALDAERYGLSSTEAERRVAEANMWRDKIDESNVPGSSESAHHTDHPNFDRSGDSMVESVRRNGVQAPVGIFHGTSYGAMIGDGHHRIAAAFSVNPNMEVPVEHHADPSDAPLSSGVYYGEPPGEVVP
jgi:hypothetical protein